MRSMWKTLLISLLLFSQTIIAETEADDEIILAKWQLHQIRFHYAGFTSKYTCDGIRYTIKRILLTVGARDDVRVEGSCYGGYSDIQPTHNLLLAFALPVPADATEIDEDTFPARWQEIKIANNNPRALDPGDCELVELFSRQVLSKLNPRELKDRSNCIPHKHKFNSPNLTATFLLKQKDQELESDP